MVTLFAVAVVQNTLVVQYTSTISPKPLPVNPTGLFSFTARFLSVPQCGTADIKGPSASQVLGASSSGSAPSPDGSLNVFWQCPDCQTTLTSFTVSFSVTDTACFAAAIQYSASFPGYITTGGASTSVPFVLTGTVAPKSPLHTVFRGPTATNIDLSFVPVLVDGSPASVGSFAQVLAVSPGSQVNQAR